MSMPNNAARHRWLAIVCAVSLVTCVLLGMFGSRHLGGGAIPHWMLMTIIALGLVSVATVPFAWRWLYRRNAG